MEKVCGPIPTYRDAGSVEGGIGLDRQKVVTEAATLEGDPIEHGNIRVVVSSRQARHRTARLRDHDLRMRDHRGNRFRSKGVNWRASCAILQLHEPWGYRKGRFFA